MTGMIHTDWRGALPPDVLVHNGNGVIRVGIDAGELSATVHRLTAIARLADFFASQAPGGDPILHLIWALDDEQRYLMLETSISGSEYPSLSDIDPSAFIEECEIYEQFGLRPAGGGLLNRIAVPPHAGPEFPRLGRSPNHDPADVHAPHVVEGHAFEFPVGPVRATAVESLYYGLVTSGEEVVDLYLFTWHKHRGIEWRLRGMTPREALFLVERAEGLSAVAHGWAFAAAVERALGIAVPLSSNRIRAAALELERIYNHAAAIVALCQSTGLSVGQASAEMALEQLLRLAAHIFGHRYLFGVIDIGGVTRQADLAALATGLEQVCGQLRSVTDALDTTNSFLDRLEATGTVDTAHARRLGLVGPIARASGVDIDTRRDHPTAVYHGRTFTPAARASGDVLARYRTFLAEIDRSRVLIAEFAEPAPARGAVAEPARGQGSGLGWTESARGEALVWVDLDADHRIVRARLRPAAVRNWRAFDDAARSQNVFTDIPIIEASFWLTVAGRAR